MEINLLKVQKWLDFIGLRMDFIFFKKPIPGSDYNIKIPVKVRIVRKDAK